MACYDPGRGLVERRTPKSWLFTPHCSRPFVRSSLFTPVLCSHPFFVHTRSLFTPVLCSHPFFVLSRSLFTPILCSHPFFVHTRRIKSITNPYYSVSCLESSQSASSWNLRMRKSGTL